MSEMPPRGGQSVSSAESYAANASSVARRFAPLFFLLLLAFLLRILLLDAQSIWWDEGISIHLAESSLSEIFADRIDNIHPPLYFVILKGWLALSGVSAFAARYLSVLAGWLQVAAVYALCSRRFGRRCGLWAALLAAVSAVLIIYAQETRVYALLPLAFIIMLAMTWELIQPANGVGRAGTGVWAVLGLVIWIAIHLHYVSAFAIAYISAWALTSFGRAGRRRDIWRWLLMGVLVLMASLPWFLTALNNWRAITAEANAGTFVAEPVTLRYLLAQVWVFHLTGLAGALARPAVAGLALLTAIALILLVVLRVGDSSARRDTLSLLAHWLVPLSSALLVWFVRPFSHPRYVVMFVPGLILLCGILIQPRSLSGKPAVRHEFERWPALVLAVLVLLLSFWGLNLYYFDQDVAKDDVRRVAAFLQEQAEEGDLILVPDTDWSFPYEYAGRAEVAMPGFDAAGPDWDHLARLTGDSPLVYALDYERGTRDWQGALPFALHVAGTQLAKIDIDELVVRAYELDQPAGAPELAPLEADFGPLQLAAAWVERGAVAGDALAVALQWRATGDLTPPASVALRLMDERGRERAAEDDPLFDRRGRPSDQWAAGERVTTYHILPLPPALPPLAYDLGIQLYEATGDSVRPLDVLDEQGAPSGQMVLLADIPISRQERETFELAAGDWDELCLGGRGTECPRSAPQSLSQPLTLAPGLLLRDFNVQQGEASPGNPIEVSLLWQAASELSDLRPRLLLEQDGAVLAADGTAPAGGRYPTTQWRQGERVWDLRTLVPPPSAQGRAELVLELGERRLSLGEIAIRQQQYDFDRPPIPRSMDAPLGDVGRLAGFDLPRVQYTTAETIPLVLLWEALGEAVGRDYVVFTHILAEDGRLIGQHDGVPASGLRPVPGWVQGEYILDPHEMIFRERDYIGPASIEVGLYDPVTGERLRTPEGVDHVLLPVTLQISAAP